MMDSTEDTYGRNMASYDGGSKGKELVKKDESLKSKSVSWSMLPYDVMYSILLKLPVASILGLQTICKTWTDIIRSPSFQGDFALVNESIPSWWVLRQHVGAHLTLYDPSAKQWLRCSLDFVPNSQEGMVCWAGHEGILLLSTKIGYELFICNPLAKTYKAIFTRFGRWLLTLPHCKAVQLLVDNVARSFKVKFIIVGFILTYDSAHNGWTVIFVQGLEFVRDMLLVSEYLYIRDQNCAGFAYVPDHPDENLYSHIIRQIHIEHHPDELWQSYLERPYLVDDSQLINQPKFVEHSGSVLWMQVDDPGVGFCAIRIWRVAPHSLGERKEFVILTEAPLHLLRTFYGQNIFKGDRYTFVGHGDSIYVMSAAVSEKMMVYHIVQNIWCIVKVSDCPFFTKTSKLYSSWYAYDKNKFIRDGSYSEALLRPFSFVPKFVDNIVCNASSWYRP